MDCELGQRLAIEGNVLLLETVHEDAVLTTVCTDSRVEADNPERAEVALLLFAVHVCMLACLNDTLLRVDKGRVTLTLVALCELLDLVVPATTDDSALYSHGLKVRDKVLNGVLIGRMQHHCAIQTLLPFALLLQQVVAAVALDFQFAGSGLTDSLLCAAVGLELRHEKCRTGREYKAPNGDCKEKIGSGPGMGSGRKNINIRG